MGTDASDPDRLRFWRQKASSDDDDDDDETPCSCRCPDEPRVRTSLDFGEFALEAPRLASSSVDAGQMPERAAPDTPNANMAQRTRKLACGTSDRHTFSPQAPPNRTRTTIMC